MKYVRFLADGVARAGTLEDETVAEGGKRWPITSVRLLPPCLPSKIIGVGRNYADHAAETGAALPTEPLLFLIPPSALVGPGGAIKYPPQSTRVDFEGELGVVIGRRCSRVPRSNALDAIMGYTIVNDVTARDLQSRDGQWARAKGFDTFAPVGPCIVDGLDPSALHIRTMLNGVVRQNCPTSKMIFGVPELIEYISAAFTLEAGDLIATGTPSGIGPMQPGDVVSVEIEGIGVLTNPVTR